METTYNKINGEFLGYPDCCIEAFGDVAIPLFARPEQVRDAVRNGFVPCEHHAQLLLNGSMSYGDLINPQRDCTIPFKDIHTEIEKKQIRKELDALKV